MTTEMHTVEVTVPGTTTRVLVERLICTAAEAQQRAVAVVRALRVAKSADFDVIETIQIEDATPINNGFRGETTT